MARYIDADALIKEAEKECNQDGSYGYMDTKSIVDLINATPTADVVEVVRCKDCKHLEVLNGDIYYARCGWHGRLFASFGRADTRIWFCADGERREDGEK